MYDKAVENGAIEGELVEFAPKFLTSLEYRLQSGQQQLTLIMEGLMALADDYVGRESGNIQDTGKSHLVGIMDEVSKVEGLQSFGTDEVRGKFVDWYATDKNGRGYELMDTSLVTPELMQDAFWAFARANPDLIAVPGSTKTKEAPTNGNRRLASGGGSSRGSTGGAPPVGLDAELATFENEFDETSKERY